jgi:hypothetical protein
MSALTNDREVNEIFEGGPQGFKAASPCPQGWHAYYGQLIVQGSDGYLYPALSASFSLTASVVVGISQVSNYNITSTTPLRTPYMQVKFGVFDFLADNGGNGPTANTLPGTLLYAADDQTVSLSNGGASRPVCGRLYSFAAGDPYPVKVQVGTAVSGSTF